FGLAVAMGITTLFITEFWKAYVLFFISMILVAVRISPFQALISELVPAHKRGTMMSLTISIGQLGMGIGGGLAGTVYAEMGFSGSTYIAAVSVILMGLIVWRFIPEPPLAKEYEGTRVGGYEGTDGE
ncbi:MAG TPA: MFS transporter, partial [Calditrichia bacterium]|nr:MFS transporter [Calditrichia bacterium]